MTVNGYNTLETNMEKSPKTESTCPTVSELRYRGLKAHSTDTCPLLLYPQYLGNGNNLDALQLINDAKTVVCILALRKNKYLKT